jgi:hypothetical protein
MYGLVFALLVCATVVGAGIDIVSPQTTEIPSVSGSPGQLQPVW